MLHVAIDLPRGQSASRTILRHPVAPRMFTAKDAEVRGEFKATHVAHNQAFSGGCICLGHFGSDIRNLLEARLPVV
jgi:hypothetical protein